VSYNLWTLFKTDTCYFEMLARDTGALPASCAPN